MIKYDEKCSDFESTLVIVSNIFDSSGILNGLESGLSIVLSEHVFCLDSFAMSAVTDDWNSHLLVLLVSRGEDLLEII